MPNTLGHPTASVPTLWPMPAVELTKFRSELRKLEMTYVVGIQSTTSVWKPGPMPPLLTRWLFLGDGWRLESQLPRALER